MGYALIGAIIMFRSKLEERAHADIAGERRADAVGKL